MGGLIRLARPQQWVKNGFVVLGPWFGMAEGTLSLTRDDVIVRTVLAVVAFSLAASASYVVNDILDAEADRSHPRKSRRPIASGLISKRTAWAYAAVLAAGSLGATLLVPRPAGGWLLAAVVFYLANVAAYSSVFKHRVIADVIALALGFVVRVVAGCVAVEIWPSTWLMNVTLFLAMFLAFGKRLGERRTLAGPGEAEAARSVQRRYSDEILRIMVGVAGVATLLTYAFYVQSKGSAYEIPGGLGGGLGLETGVDGEPVGFNLLWLSVLPATYALLRCIVLVERGEYDDPTELSYRDLPFMVAAGVFALLVGTVTLIAGKSLEAPMAASIGEIVEHREVGEPTNASVLESIGESP
ncbi:MAG: UbiA prenyltransferase family protein [Planctomycetota bacterium]